MSEKRARVRLIPRAPFRPFLESEKKRSCLVVHRRGGKTFHEVMKLIKSALTFDRRNMRNAPPRFAYFAPTQSQAKDIAWGYLKRFAHGVEGRVNESELRVTFPSNQDSSITLYSGKNYERARGLYLDGVVMDENADMPPDAWDSVIEPCLADYDGWADFIGTPKGKNAFWRKWEEAIANPDEWFSLMLKASESGILDDDWLRRKKASTDPKIYAREFECDFSADIPGAIYAKLMEETLAAGRVCDFEPTGGPVYTTWDLGNPANTSVIYWENNGPARRVIDCDIGLNFELSERVAHMLQTGYNLAGHFLPHDAGSKQANGLSFAVELRRAGLKNVQVIPRTNDPEIRINATKRAFPSTWFRKATTQTLRDALSMYHYQEAKDQTGWITNKICHDWSSHPADSFGYFAEAELQGFLSKEQRTREGRKFRKPKVASSPGY